MAKRLTFLSLLLCVYFSICCRTTSNELTPEEFARFYADVVIAQESALDSATAIDSAFTIAEQEGISADQLNQFRDRMHADPVLWVTVWELVVEEVQSRKNENRE